MSLLITSDIHLTDKDRDNYRWGLFPWLKEQAIKHQPEAILFLGDTTDSKDKHPAKLTNRLVEAFTDLTTVTNQVYVLRGNHDYIDPETPFFKFLSHIPKLTFVMEPTRFSLFINKIGYLAPNQRIFEWLPEYKEADYLFCHQTFQGAKAENDSELDGIKLEETKNIKGQIISGDVHVPQTLGKVIYVGSPYHVHFGDRFLPRVVLLTPEKIQNLFYKTISKHTLRISNPEDLKELKLKKGDQVKIEVSLDDIVDWEVYKKSIRNYCQEEGIDMQEIKFKKKDSTVSLAKQDVKLKSMTPQEIFNAYCDAMKIGEDTKVFGIEILGEATK